MSERVSKVFVSAVSQELAGYRRAVSQQLVGAGVLPVSQETFPPDYLAVADFLRHKIEPCDAVICLVGFAFGAAPHDGGEPPRSYTQLEYDIARQLNKPVYLFFASEDCPPDEPNSQDDRQGQLQQEHRDALMGSDYLWQTFSSHEELRLHVARLVQDLAPGVDRLPLRILHPCKTLGYFAGRQFELGQLNVRLRQPEPCIVAVVGIGGQGKSSLVDHWLRQQDPLPFDAGFWCSADRSGFTFDDFLDQLLTYLTVGRFDKRDSPTIAERALRVIDLLRQRRTLIVIDAMERWLSGWNTSSDDPDSVQSSDHRDGYFEGLDDFLIDAASLSSGTHVVVTSRALPAVLEGAAYEVVPVDSEGNQSSLTGLSDEDAAGLLARLGVQGATSDRIAAAREYDNHPLALDVLGNLLRKRFGGKITNIGRVTVLDKRKRFFQLFEETRQRLPGRKEAERFLQVVSLCVENPSLAVVAAGLGIDCSEDRDWEDGLIERAVELTEWGLVQWDPLAETVGQHSVVRQYFAALVPDAAGIHRRLFRWYQRQPIAQDVSSLEDVRPMLLAIEHALRAGELDECMRLVFASVNEHYTFIEWLAAWGHLSRGVELLGDLAAAAVDPRRAELLSAKAGLLRQLGRPEEAVAVLDGVIEGLQRQVGDDPGRLSLVLSQALINRGNALWQIGRERDALTDYDQAPAQLEHLVLLGQASLFDLVSARLNRANALKTLGRLNEARRENETAIDLCRSCLTDDDDPAETYLAASLINQGIVLQALLVYDGALTHLREGVDRYNGLIRRGRKELHPKWIHAQITLGRALTDQRHDDEAVATLNEPVRAARALVDADRAELEPLMGLALLNRGLANLRRGVLDAALRDSEAALATFERLSRRRSDVAGWHALAIINRSEVRCQLGDRKGAAEDRARGFGMARQLIEQGHTDVRLLVMRKSFSAAVYQPDEENFSRLHETLLEVEGLIRQGAASDHMLVALGVGLERLEEVAEQLEAAGFDQGLLIRLRQAVDQCKIG